MSGSRRRWITGAVVATVALALGGVAAARKAPAPSPQPAVRGIELRVPHAPGSIALDGDVDDPGWRGLTGRTRAFVTVDGGEARPYSEARFAWGDGQLYVALYAADQDIVTAYRDSDLPLWVADAFDLRFSSGTREELIDVSPLGVITDATRPVGGRFDYAWSSDAHVSRELDGTPNDSRDDDEEWLIEMAIPLESLGLEGKSGERVAVTVGRCDSPKRAPRVCASWNGAAGGTLVLE